MNIGDRVIVNGLVDGINFRGNKGTIVAVGNLTEECCETVQDIIGIEFDEHLDERLHDMNVLRKPWGYWVDKSNITIIEKKEEETYTEVQKAIVDECDAIKGMLLEKNRKYGNSALEPVRIFSKASVKEQILVRLDDKLSRLKNVQEDDTEDVVMDLVGYLILLRIAEKQKGEE